MAGSGSTTFYQFDLQGNTVTRTNSSATVLDYHSFDPGGGQYTSATTSDPYAGYEAQLGYYRDAETGLYCTGYRYYASSIGRFLTQDPIGQNGGVNVFSYAQNNSFSFVDPSGLQAHGNALSDRETWLYGLYHIDGSFLKWGQSINPYTRYGPAFMEDKQIIPLFSGPKFDIVPFENTLERNVPGPLNQVNWAAMGGPLDAERMSSPALNTPAFQQALDAAQQSQPNQYCEWFSEEFHQMGENFTNNMESEGQAIAGAWNSFVEFTGNEVLPYDL